MVGRWVVGLSVWLILSGFAVKDVKVIDGDTIKVITSDGTKEVIRLYGIDAPELKQRYGHQSKDWLKSQVEGHAGALEILPKYRDRYGRLVAKVYIIRMYTPWGSNLPVGEDINYNSVLFGQSWWDARYSPKDAGYLTADGIARSKHLGLWKDLNPIPPWVFRKEKK